MAKSKNNGPPQVDGFVNLYKPAGITSMEALRRIKRITGQRRKVGHGGTMDPLAQGILPVCFGQATRLMDYVVQSSKRYRMEVALGIATTTFDAEGPVVSNKDPSGVTLEAIERELQSFVGLIDQIPPMYSAVKVQGQRLYNLARAGIEVGRKARPVEIHNIRMVDYAPPILVLEVDSGPGVYMRSLANDLGEVLECGAHVANLERLSSGGFHAEESVTLDQFEQSAAEPNGWQVFLHPIDWVLRNLRSISVGRQAQEYLRNGQSISVSSPIADAAYLEPFRAYGSDGRFLALVRLDRATNTWQPLKVFQIETPSPLAPAYPEASSRARNSRFHNV